MNATVPRLTKLELLLAGLLHYGTVLASVTIGLGIALSWIEARTGAHSLASGLAMDIAETGIAMFILLPSLRVALMLAVFLRERDYRFAVIAALVLSIILLGFLLGVRTAGAMPG